MRPAKVARLVADAKIAVSGRPRVRGTPSSMAILPFAKHPVRVKKLWKDRETLKKEEIRLHTLTRGPRYDVSGHALLQYYCVPVVQKYVRATRGRSPYYVLCW